LCLGEVVHDDGEEKAGSGLDERVMPVDFFLAIAASPFEQEIGEDRNDVENAEAMLTVRAFRKTVGGGPEYRLAGQGANGQYIEGEGIENISKPAGMKPICIYAFWFQGDGCLY
jgi:hypothetical protein